jgi:hypothetical protein
MTRRKGKKVRRNTDHQHELVYVTSNLDVVSKFTRIAPPPDRMRQNMPKGTKYLMRLFPKLGVWRVYDARKFLMNPSCGQFYKAPSPSAVTEQREAAIGYALLMP